jgi:hypothetical protein
MKVLGRSSPVESELDTERQGPGLIRIKSLFGPHLNGAVTQTYLVGVPDLLSHLMAWRIWNKTCRASSVANTPHL